MEIKTLEGHMTITINTKGIDFDNLMLLVDQIPTHFKKHLAISIGKSLPNYYHKKRTKSFNKLEKEALSKITGISIELL